MYAKGYSPFPVNGFFISITSFVQPLTERIMLIAGVGIAISVFLTTQKEVC